MCKIQDCTHKSYDFLNKNSKRISLILKFCVDINWFEIFFKKSRYSDIKPLAKIMESQHLEDIYSAFSTS